MTVRDFIKKNWLVLAITSSCLLYLTMPSIVSYFTFFVKTGGINPLTNKCRTVPIAGSAQPLRRAQMRNAPKEHTYCQLEGKDFLLKEIIFVYDGSIYEVNYWRLKRDKNGQYQRHFVK